METTVKILFALAVVGLLVPSQYARAATYDEIVQDIDFAALSGADEIQNNLDDGALSNFDTWDPVPSGSWFGGWSRESRLRLADVPDTDFSVVYATVARFSSDIIMSGAARTVVRLPIHTPSSGCWTEAFLHVYEISADCNWTFTYENSTADVWGTALGNARINFTAGSHELIFWSQPYDPSDASPTDYDDHFTRSNRTYAIVDAPIRPGVLTLWVTTVHYPSDAYVDAYVQPDTLDSEGSVNHSSVAIYNSPAPDTYDLEVKHSEFSWGYSWDFRNGFGNSAYGLNVWMEDGDDLEFLYWVNFSKVDDSTYLTFHLPYQSSVTNISWDINIFEYDPSDGTFQSFIVENNYICNDFILFSLDTDWATCSTANSLDETGWFYISLQCDNDTRIRVPLWDPSVAPAFPNRSWEGPMPYVVNVWSGDSTDPSNYDMRQWIRHDVTGRDYYYHWKAQASLQWNDYYWSRSAPPDASSEDPLGLEDMTLTQQVFYTAGSLLLSTGDQYVEIGGPAGMVGQVFRAAGLAAQAVAHIEDLPDPFGWARDKIERIKGFFQDLGSWLWRVGQEVVGALRWFVETVTYYASIILGIIVLMIALIILFLPMWFSAKMGQIIVLLLRGRYDRAVEDLGEIAGKARSTLGRGGD